jgi:hypothetical protein
LGEGQRRPQQSLDPAVGLPLAGAVFIKLFHRLCIQQRPVQLLIAVSAVQFPHRGPHVQRRGLNGLAVPDRAAELEHQK